MVPHLTRDIYHSFASLHGLQFYSIILPEMKKDVNNHVNGRLKRELKNTIETNAHWL
jgi:hypothetical protein